MEIDQKIISPNHISIFAQNHAKGVGRMNSKTLALIGVSAIVIAVIFSATVMAGQPGPVQSWLNVIIMNNASQPVPADVQNPFPWEVMGEVNVTNTEPILIDGTVDVNGTVIVDDSDPVNVDIQGTVPADVSGWLHTTNAGHARYVVDYGHEDLVLDHLNTTGYRQITLRIFTMSLQSNCEYLISYDIDGWVFRNETGEHLIYKPAPGGFQEILVMDVISQAISVSVHNYLGPDPVGVDVYWYLTT